MVRERYSYPNAAMVDRLRELSTVDDLYRRTVMISAFLMITLHRLELIDIGDENSDELQEMTEEMAEQFKEEYEAKQKRLLDVHSRSCGDSITRYGDASWRDIS